MHIISDTNIEKIIKCYHIFMVHDEWINWIRKVEVQQEEPEDEKDSR